MTILKSVQTNFFSHKIFKLNIQYKFSSFMNTSNENKLTNSIYEWLKNRRNIEF